MPPAGIASTIDGTSTVSPNDSLRRVEERLAQRFPRSRVAVDDDALGHPPPIGVPERRDLAHLAERGTSALGRTQSRLSVQYGRPRRSMSDRRFRAATAEVPPRPIRPVRRRPPRRCDVVGRARTTQRHGDDGARRSIASNPPIVDRRRAHPVARVRSRSVEELGEVVEAHIFERVDDGESVAGLERPHVGDAEHATPRSERRAHAGGGVLDRETVGRVEPACVGADQVGRGLRFALALGDLVAGHGRHERAVGQRGEDRVDEAAPRHRDERARDTGRAQVGQQLAGARPPWDLALETGDHAVEQPIDDLSRR